MKRQARLHSSNFKDAAQKAEYIKSSTGANLDAAFACLLWFLTLSVGLELFVAPSFTMATSLDGAHAIYFIVPQAIGVLILVIVIVARQHNPMMSSLKTHTYAMLDHSGTT